MERWTKNYINRVHEYGAVPVVLSPDLPTHLPDGALFTPDESGRLSPEVLAQLDGLILAGGGDVHPRYFGQEPTGADPSSIDIRRDELELGLARAALAANMPLWGICRGCQVLNVAAGGSMLQHFDNHRTPEGGPTRFHDVLLAPSTRLRAIVGEEALPVNTYHHQGLDRATLAPIFQVAAVATYPDDWLVEAYESPTHDWVVGVQWHPERIFELGEGHRRLWDSFMKAASDYHHKGSR